MSKQKKFQATSLRKLLVTLFVIVILGLAGAFYLGLQIIREYSVEVEKTSKDAAASAKQVEDLAALRQQLADTQARVSKADEIFSSDAEYRSEAATALNRYAEVAGISINNTSFTPGDQQPEGTRRVTIGIDSPASYDNLVYFLQLIEGSLPKMQVAALDITRASGNEVTVGDIDINVYIR